jgi:hypothetical protein
MRAILTALALAAASQAVAAPAATPAAKPAATKPAPKTAPAKTPALAKAATFDSSDPASMIAFLGGTGAKASVASTADDAVFLKVETPGGAFGIQYVGCNPQGKACKALVFSTAFARSTANVVQINGFNRIQVSCRGFLAEDNKPNVAYSTLADPRMTADQMKLHVGVWQGCLANFGEFSKDPNGFLIRPQ